MVEIIENQDIQPQKPSTKTQNIEDVNSLIQKKCQENQIDKEGQKSITDFFKNIENKLPKEYKKDLLNYIQNINGNDLFILSISSDEEKDNEEKNIIDQIDIKKDKPLIETYSNIEDQKSNIEDQKSNIEDQKSNIEDQKSNIEDQKSNIENKDKLDLTLKEQFQQTKDSYDKLLQEKPELKPNQDQINQQKQQFEQDGTLKKLEQKGFSQDQINDFVSFNYTYTHHQEELKDTEFAKSYQKLEELFGGDKMRSPIGELKSPDIVNKKIDESSTLKSYAVSIDTGNNTSSKEYTAKKEELSKLDNHDDINQAFEKEENQILIQKYKNIITTQPKEDPSVSKEQNDQQILLRKKNILLEANELEQQTQETLQKRILGSAISGLAGYFDFSTDQKEQIESDFIANNLDIDQDIFSLKGNINGNEIDIKYNLLDGNLSIKDFLFQEKTKDLLKIDQNNYQDLNIHLPSIFLLTDQAKQLKDQEITTNNPQEYIKDLNENLHQQLTSQFTGHQEIVKVRLERSIQKNLAVQETLSNINKIINPETGNIFTKEIGENTTNNKDLFNLVKLIDNSLESYSISEIEERRKNTDILTKFINKSMYDQTPNNKVAKTFKDKLQTNHEKNREENQINKTQNIYKLIQSFSITKNGKEVVDLDSFKKLTTQLEASTPDTDKLAENTQKLFDPTLENPYSIIETKRTEPLYT